ncbi:MAG: hypothetical protein JWN76_3686 [Chitinophagaceae bacterium]|nr:hypothetical protein [Chitinophagaceae bacterium]
MKKYLEGLYYSMPVQLFFLHFRRYQGLLVFWYILFATVGGHFMFSFGANSLYLAPEYMGKVNALSAGIVGSSIALFVMSWNITTFILNTRHIRFLATTAQPFLKYYINNFIFPAIFLVYYFIRAANYHQLHQLTSTSDILFAGFGFIVGFILFTTISFFYFYSADKTIYRSLAGIMRIANRRYERAIKKRRLPLERHEIRIDWFLSAKLQLRKPRDVRHYSPEFLESIFRRHHFAAVIAIVLAYIFLIGIGYFLDSPVFLLPAAASSTLFFSVLIGVSGAFSLFLRNWSLLVLCITFIALSFALDNHIIEFRNKVYGLNYHDSSTWPEYSQENINSLANTDSIAKDKQLYLPRLEAWKKRQGSDKPVMFIINVSGGGLRSAGFCLNVLQYLDSISKGKMLGQTALITGSSGGMLGAAYFRELYLERLRGKKINLSSGVYAENIAKDILNAVFSSMVTRDILSPKKLFDYSGNFYNKDRGYAFEQQLNENTGHALDKQLKDYLVPESQGLIPGMVFSSVITRDGRKMLISTQPSRFLMKMPDSTRPKEFDPDAIDYYSLFKNQHPENTRILTALRMNATFPYVLPNVWLPTTPVIDVMDAGLRDNFGIETALRFLNVFHEWIKNNVSKVVVIQIRDTKINDWEKEGPTSDLIGSFTKPFFLLQNNLYRLQDYYQHDQLDYFAKTLGDRFEHILFQYIPLKQDAPASMSFHLTAGEKRDIHGALQDSLNRASFDQVMRLIRPVVLTGNNF